MNDFAKSTSLRLEVRADTRAYPIQIGAQATPLDFDFDDFIPAKQILVVSNETVAPLYLDALLARLGNKQVAVCILPDGEKYKTQDSVNQIYDALLQNGFGRDCALVALGGGVVGDITGFAAASFMRGVDFAQVPTTLLAQVDSSVGGKTGINHPLGKNMIGAFWQPISVLADMSTLATLPKREFLAGMAEVIKYALIMDAPFLDWLWERRDRLLAYDYDTLAQTVYRCCQHKATVVAEDEKEKGRRALLNLGHTFGHAIETHTGYGAWLHGEAVAVGMAQAAALSYLQGHLSAGEFARVVQVLRDFGLPTEPPAIDPSIALALMGRDKKVKNGQIRFVLLDGIGKAFVSADVDETHLRRVLTQSPTDILRGDA